MEVQIRRLATDGREFPIGKGCHARALVWPGMGSIYRSMHHLVIPGSCMTDELVHANAEAAYFIVQGSGRVTDTGSGEPFALRSGKMVHLDAGTRYRFEADDGEPMIVIGGPCPPDPSLYGDQ